MITDWGQGMLYAVFLEEKTWTEYKRYSEPVPGTFTPGVAIQAAWRIMKRGR